MVEKAGGRFLDGGIIGPPPRGKAKTNLYLSGPGAADLEQLAGPQLNVHVVSERIADASALKMCYGALNKGTQALWLEVLIAAQRLGVDELLEQQLRQSQRDLLRLGARPVSDAPAESLSLGAGNARNLEDARPPPASRPKVFKGAADIYALRRGDPARQGNAGEPRQVPHR